MGAPRRFSIQDYPDFANLPIQGGLSHSNQTMCNFCQHIHRGLQPSPAYGNFVPSFEHRQNCGNSVFTTCRKNGVKMIIVHITTATRSIIYPIETINLIYRQNFTNNFSIIWILVFLTFSSEGNPKNLKSSVKEK